MKKILALVLSLTLISGICAAILAYVNQLTKDPIAEMKAKTEQEAIRAVMPSGVESVEAAGDYNIGRDAAGKILGYAAKGCDGGGYGGDIELMVGFAADGKSLVRYRVLLAAETPGLGMKLTGDDFTAQFSGKDASALAVVKSGKPHGNEIQAITSATITSKAVCRAIANACAKVPKGK